MPIEMSQSQEFNFLKSLTVKVEHKKNKNIYLPTYLDIDLNSFWPNSRIPHSILKLYHVPQSKTI